RVSGVRIGNTGLDVARQADFESDASVIDVLRQLGVLDEPGAVTDSICAANMHCLANRLGAIAFAGVYGHGEVVLPRVAESLGVDRRRISLLSSGEIERHHAIVLEFDGEPRQLERA